MSAEKIADIQQVEGQMPGTETLTGGIMEAEDEMTRREKLLPRPSDDPRDPLNWPLWLKVTFTTQKACHADNLRSLSSSKSVHWLLLEHSTLQLSTLPMDHLPKNSTYRR